MNLGFPLGTRDTSQLRPQLDKGVLDLEGSVRPCVQKAFIHTTSTCGEYVHPETQLLCAIPIESGTGSCAAMETGLGV